MCELSDNALLTYVKTKTILIRWTIRTEIYPLAGSTLRALAALLLESMTKPVRCSRSKLLRPEFEVWSHEQAPGRRWHWLYVLEGSPARRTNASVTCATFPKKTNRLPLPEQINAAGDGRAQPEPVHVTLTLMPCHAMPRHALAWHGSAQ